MVEYIERGAAIDAIMKVYVRTAGYKARERVFEAEEAVHRLPVADVAPVVRCKDCKHSYITVGARCCSYGAFYDVAVREDFFCADGVKREAADD